ncbi:hypothetical protein CAPTEDRAFT_123759 [Capitella teleta]|uniref:Cytochrome P450 n=1 Tax=Capitella teleta TaxID=283909 RepID=R7TVM4_CAPTE|nr:hypothetical protein CAPTEDRAFT_123759 [Capitella teleta]|eukprot:ELT95060.1 hypothetical protein CAPTEDRAFT_123759 [Capitella teleta]
MEVLCAFGVIVLAAIWFWKACGSVEQLPHYKGWPVVGNLFQVERDRPELTFSEWTKDLGPVFSVKMLHKQFVVLGSFDAIYEALVKKGKSLSGRQNKHSFRLDEITDHFRNIVRSQVTDPSWKKLRMISHKKIKMYDTGMKRIEGISRDMIANLLEEFQNTSQRSFDPESVIYNTVMNVIMCLLLGQTFSVNDDIFKKMVQFEQSGIKAWAQAGRGAELDLCPWLRFFGNETYKLIRHMVELRNQLWERMKEEASRGDHLLKKDEEDLRLVSALRDTLAEDGSELSEKHLRAHVMVDIAFAGTATTSNTLCAYLNIISQHPKVQEKLQEEVDRVVGVQRIVSLSDKGKMPYTQATILELLRFTSVAPLGVPHMPYEDTVIQGKTVPAGSTVLMNLYHLHHDEDFWENSFEFQPERFLDEDGGLVSASHPNRRHLMPFSAGPRVCLGEVLAKTRLFLVIASLAQKFNILPGEVSTSCDPRLLQHGLVLSTAKFEIVAKEREIRV